MKYLGNIFLGLALCLTAPVVFAVKEVDNHYENAVISFQENNIQTSIIHLKNILKMDENHMPARLLLARSYLRLGNGIAAELALEKTNAEQVDKNQVVALYAHAYLLQKQFDKVIEVSEPELHPDDIAHQLLLYRGQAYIGLKQNRSADFSFKQALRIDPLSKTALLGRAQIALANVRPKRALDFIEQALTIDETYINAWIFKAKILQQNQSIKEALTAIDRALALDERHMSARLTKAMLLISADLYKEAEAHVDFILDAIPNEPRAGYLKAIILASYSRNSKASQLSEEVLSEVLVTLSAVPEEIMRNTPDYYYLAGQVNYQFGNLEDARKYLTKFLSYAEYEINTVLMIASIDLQNNEAESARSLLLKTNLARPNDLRILTLLGLAYLQLENEQKAEFYFEHVLRMNPSSAAGLTNLAKLKIQSGQYQSAIHALLSIKDKNINPIPIKLLLIDSYQQSHQIKKAISIAQELIERFPNESFFYQRLGALYGFNNQLPLAKASFKIALNLDKKNILAMVHLARMDNISGNHQDALTFLHNKLKEFPKNTLIMAEISDSYVLKEDIANGLLWIKKAYAQATDDFYLLKKYASILLLTKEVKEAIELTERFVDRNRKNLAASELLAEIYLINRDYRKAIALFSDIVKKSHRKAPAYMKLAKAQLKANNELSAIQSYKKATIEDDHHLEAYRALVELIIKNKDEDYANVLIAHIEKITGDKSHAKQLKGDLYFELGLLAKAKKYYLASIEISENKSAIIGLYKTNKKLNQAEKSIPLLLKWLEKKPNDLLVGISLADSYRYSNQLQTSLELYNTMLNKYGQLPILLNNIANVSYELGDTEKAKKYAEQAYSYLSHNVAIMDTLAWIETRLGNYNRALPLFRKALAKDYDNAEVKYHLAVALYALSRNEEAKTLLLQSVNSDQEFREKSAAAQLLADKLKS